MEVEFQWLKNSVEVHAFGLVPLEQLLRLTWQEQPP